MDGVLRGTDVLTRWLRDDTFDIRALAPADFPHWLARHRPRWDRDPVFRQRETVRDIRRSDPNLRTLEADVRAAEAAFDDTAAAGRMAELGRIAAGLRRAVAGLSAAPNRAAKLAAARESLAAAEGEHAALANATRERRALDALRAELDAKRAASGLDHAEARLAELQTGRGRGTGRAGDRFEDVAADIARRVIAPEVSGGADVKVIRGVRLGTAGAEFDALVVAAEPGKVVDVLAAVEAKRDANGLAHGFLHRQSDLRWLTGDRASYDPAAHRTRAFPTGHFDREAVHAEGGAEFCFGPASFARFRPDAGDFLERLYLVTRPGPLWGLSPAALVKVAARVASADDPAALFPWCRALAGPVETPDVLRRYAAGAGRQVVVVAGAGLS